MSGRRGQHKELELAALRCAREVVTEVPRLFDAAAEAPPRGASVDCIESKDYGSCSGVGCDNGTTSRAQSPQPPQLLPVAFELLPPYSPSVPDGERHKYDSVRVLLEEYFVPQRKIVRNAVYCGRSGVDPTRKLDASTKYEACAVAGLWLGPELVCGAALRLNFPPTSCAGLGRAPPAEVAAALVAGRWRPQLQVLFMRTAPGHGRRGLGRLLSCLIGRQAARAQHELVSVAMSGDDAAPFWTNAGFAAPPLQPPQLPPTASLLHRAEAARRAAAARRAVTDGEPHAMRCEVWVRSLLPPLPSAEPNHREEQEEGELEGEGEDAAAAMRAAESNMEVAEHDCGTVSGKAAHARLVEEDMAAAVSQAAEHLRAACEQVGAGYERAAAAAAAAAATAAAATAAAATAAAAAAAGNAAAADGAAAAAAALPAQSPVATATAAATAIAVPAAPADAAGRKAKRKAAAAAGAAGPGAGAAAVAASPSGPTVAFAAASCAPPSDDAGSAGWVAVGTEAAAAPSIAAFTQPQGKKQRLHQSRTPTPAPTATPPPPAAGLLPSTASGALVTSAGPAVQAAAAATPAAATPGMVPREAPSAACTAATAAAAALLAVPAELKPAPAALLPSLQVGPASGAPAFAAAAGDDSVQLGAGDTRASAAQRPPFALQPPPQSRSQQPQPRPRQSPLVPEPGAALWSAVAGGPWQPSAQLQAQTPPPRPGGGSGRGIGAGGLLTSALLAAAGFGQARDRGPSASDPEDHAACQRPPEPEPDLEPDLGLELEVAGFGRALVDLLSRFEGIVRRQQQRQDHQQQRLRELDEQAQRRKAGGCDVAVQTEPPEAVARHDFGMQAGPPSVFFAYVREPVEPLPPRVPPVLAAAGSGLVSRPPPPPPPAPSLPLAASTATAGVAMGSPRAAGAFPDIAAPSASAAAAAAAAATAGTGSDATAGGADATAAAAAAISPTAPPTPAAGAAAACPSLPGVSGALSAPATAAGAGSCAASGASGGKAAVTGSGVPAAAEAPSGAAATAVSTEAVEGGGSPMQRSLRPSRWERFRARLGAHTPAAPSVPAELPTPAQQGGQQQRQTPTTAAGTAAAALAVVGGAMTMPPPAALATTTPLPPPAPPPPQGASSPSNAQQQEQAAPSPAQRFSSWPLTSVLFLRDSSALMNCSSTNGNSKPLPGSHTTAMAQEAAAASPQLRRSHDTGSSDITAAAPSDCWSKPRPPASADIFAAAPPQPPSPPVAAALAATAQAAVRGPGAATNEQQPPQAALPTSVLSTSGGGGGTVKTEAQPAPPSAAPLGLVAPSPLAPLAPPPPPPPPTLPPPLQSLFAPAQTPLQLQQSARMSSRGGGGGGSGGSNWNPAAAVAVRLEHWAPAALQTPAGHLHHSHPPPATAAAGAGAAAAAPDVAMQSGMAFAPAGSGGGVPAAAAAAAAADPNYLQFTGLQQQGLLMPNAANDFSGLPMYPMAASHAAPAAANGPQLPAAVPAAAAAPPHAGERGGGGGGGACWHSPNPMGRTCHSYSHSHICGRSHSRSRSRSCSRSRSPEGDRHGSGGGRGTQPPPAAERRPPPPPPPQQQQQQSVLEESCQVLSNVPPELASRAEAGDFAWLGIGLLQRYVEYQRSWPDVGSSCRCVQVKLLGSATHVALFRAAKDLKQQLGVRMTPFLSPEVRLLRDRRAETFRQLQLARKQPKWEGASANISFLNGQGVRVAFLF